MREIAIRGFANEKFNTTYGKGLFKRAVFNGSVEVRNPYVKYLVDYSYLNHWEHSAKEFQLRYVTLAYQEQLNQVDDALFSWIQHYDPVTKSKTSTDGFSVYLPTTKELCIVINDALHDVNDQWSLTVSNCKSLGANKPVFIASNMDLNTQTPA